MCCALKWPEHMSRMRLIQSMKESDIQNVELPTWFIMDSKGGDDWLRPSHPMSEERGVSLITVVEWLRFIQARSQVDQEGCKW